DELEQTEDAQPQGEENEEQDGEGEQEAEGDPIAQRLLEREEAQRARRRAVRRQGGVPVETDW
ncbi:MAG: hypothetical protein KDA28_03405, partial [Phycisphaerales bacterium]|nr:hypothetical protein [Phycisphaerales bacterium]